MATISRAPQVRRRKSGFRWRSLLIGLAFISPWLVGFVLFTLYPMIASAAISLYDYHPVSDSVYVGLDNYGRLLSDEDFRIALGNTAYMVALAVPLGLVCAFLCAVILNFRIRGQGFFRTLYYLPTVVPSVASTFLFLFLLNPEIGLVNGALRLVGIQGPNWVNDPNWAKPALILLGLWGIGGSSIIYLAGLNDVPTMLYEAAELDGAGWWRKLINVTVPMMTPIILYDLIVSVIGVFQYFGPAYLWAKSCVGCEVGDPFKSTLFYSLYLFQNAIERLKMGYASAMAWVLFIIIFVFTILLLKTSRRWTNYDV